MHQIASIVHKHLQNQWFPKIIDAVISMDETKPNHLENRLFSCWLLQSGKKRKEKKKKKTDKRRASILSGSNTPIYFSKDSKSQFSEFS